MEEYTEEEKRLLRCVFGDIIRVINEGECLHQYIDDAEYRKKLWKKWRGDSIPQRNTKR